jgi:hypothetical protein
MSYNGETWGNETNSQGKRGQQRASKFRPHNEINRVTKPLDAHSNRIVIKQQGKIGLTKHNTILAMLEMGALRYHNKSWNKVEMDEVPYNEAINATSTLDTESLS